MTERTCSVVEDGVICGKPVAGRGWCSKHYQRWQSNGDPLVSRRRAQAAACIRPGCGKPTQARDLCAVHYHQAQRAERGPCSVQDCVDPWYARGLCAIHYQRQVRTGSTNDPKMAGRECTVAGCTGRARAKDLCAMHYGRQRKYGSTEAPAKPERGPVPCLRDGCDTFTRRRNGLCERHYREANAAARPQCEVEGCHSPAIRERMCEAHCGWSRTLYNRYHITAEQYEALLEAQGGVCAICGRAPDGTKRNKRLVVDHDHQCCPGDTSCGECVRGLLCIWCNRFLGLALDDPMRLIAAVRYLERTGSAKPGTGDVIPLRRSRRGQMASGDETLF